MGRKATIHAQTIEKARLELKDGKTYNDLKKTGVHESFLTAAGTKVAEELKQFVVQGKSDTEMADAGFGTPLIERTRVVREAAKTTNIYKTAVDAISGDKATYTTVAALDTAKSTLDTINIPTAPTDGSEDLHQTARDAKAAKLVTLNAIEPALAEEASVNAISSTKTDYVDVAALNAAKATLNAISIPGAPTDGTEDLHQTARDAKAAKLVTLNAIEPALTEEAKPVEADAAIVQSLNDLVPTNNTTKDSADDFIRNLADKKSAVILQSLNDFCAVATVDNTVRDTFCKAETGVSSYSIEEIENLTGETSEENPE